MDRKNQYSENEYTTQSNLQIQCNPYQAAAAKSLQSCPTLHDPIDGSPRGSPVPEILQARKAMTNLDSILKSRDLTLPTRVHLVKAIVFPVVMYGCEDWTIKKAECLSQS